MTIDVAGRIELASLGWSAEIRVSRTTPEMARHLEGRWEGLSSSPPTSRPADAIIELESVDAPVGLAMTPLVEIHVAWGDRNRGTLTASSLEAEVEWVGGVLVVRGRAHAPHARGALEAAFRAVAALTLARRHVVVIHASAVASEGRAVVFLGASEAGKTTTARRLGREGFRRLADDMIAVDLKAEPRLHLLPFERAGRWSAAIGEEQPPVLVAAAVVAKGRPLAVETSPRPNEIWAAARLALPCAPGDQESALADFAALCRIPTFEVGVPPSGALSELVHEMMREAPRKRLDDAGARGHSAPKLGDSPHFVGAFDEACVISRAPNVAWRVLNGSVVLVAPSSPLVHTLNPVGTFVWERADQARVSSIVDAVVNEFAVTRTQALVDVEQFVADLVKKQLLVVTRPA